MTGSPHSAHAQEHDVRTEMSRASKLSALWTMVLLSMLFRDVHELITKEFLEDALSRTVSDQVLLLSGIVLTLPILMVPLNKMLPRRWSRPANLGVAAIIFIGIVANAPGDLDDYWFAAVEILGLIAIAWLAWRWPVSPPRENPLK